MKKSIGKTAPRNKLESEYLRHQNPDREEKLEVSWEEKTLHGTYHYQIRDVADREVLPVAGIVYRNMVEKEEAKILWDFQIDTDKQVMENQPDSVVVDKHQKRAVVIDVACSSDYKHQEKGTQETGGIPGPQRMVEEDVGGEDTTDD